jgi:hypothetical protein
MLPPVTIGTAAALLGFVLTVVTGALWFRRAFAVQLPDDRTPFVVAMAVAAGLGVYAFTAGVGWVAGLLAGASVLAGGVFITLVAISAQKGSSGGFEVGQPVPDFSAPDETGQPFALSSQAGRPLLLKFFRGHW